MTFIDQLIKTGYLKTPAIIKAFQTINRQDFLPENLKEAAELNQALPIGSGQTISQPLVVAFMLEELQAKPGQIVLDIGTGSGWTSALLAEIVGSIGKVVSVEIVEELSRFGQRNTEKYNFSNIEFRIGNWQDMVKEKERFDRIHAAATAPSLPTRLIDHLKSLGRLVIPVEESHWGDHVIKTIEKDRKGKIKITDHPGFMFVPML